MNKGLLAHFGLMVNQLDSYAASIISRMIPAPSPVIQAAINNAIIELKDTGFLPRMDSLYVPKKAAAQQNGCLDWRRNVSAALNGSATWDATYGFVGSSAASSWIDSGFNPSTDAIAMSLNSFSVGAYVSQVGSTSLDYLFGATNVAATSQLNLFESTSDAMEARTCSSGNTFTANSQAAAALMVLQRTASNAAAIFKDGTNITTGGSTAASVALPDRNIYICGNNSASPSGSTAKVGVWWAGDEFSGAEQLAIKAIFDTYFAAIP